MKLMRSFYSIRKSKMQDKKSLIFGDIGANVHVVYERRYEQITAMFAETFVSYICAFSQIK